jgi:hypothetical protein
VLTKHDWVRFEHYAKWVKNLTLSEQDFTWSEKSTEWSESLLLRGFQGKPRELLPMLRSLDWDCASREGLLLGLHHLVTSGLKTLGVGISGYGSVSGAAQFFEILSPRLNRLELVFLGGRPPGVLVEDGAVRLVRQFPEIKELWLNNWIVGAILKSDPCPVFSGVRVLEVWCEAVWEIRVDHVHCAKKCFPNLRRVMVELREKISFCDALLTGTGGMLKKLTVQGDATEQTIPRSDIYPLFKRMESGIWRTRRTGHSQYNFPKQPIRAAFDICTARALHIAPVILLLRGY